MKKRSALILLFALLASVAALAQGQAGPNRPIGLPEEFVITPFGYFHPSCVRQLAEGDTLLEDGPAIQHAHGTIEQLVACKYPHYTPGGEIAVEGLAGAVPPSIGYSWIEAAGATTSSSYGELAAGWIVPPAPASNDGQTIYFFPGLEQTDSASTTILQPVLGWNADFAGSWGIASWNCCPGGNGIESKPASVSSGDKITGVVRDTCTAGTLSCPTWTVAATDTTLGKSAKLPGTTSAGHTFNWAFAGALEVYRVVQCSDYPANGQLTLSGVTLDDDNFNPISNPNWSVINFSSGLTPQCGYGIQVAANQVTLDYATFVTLHSFIATDGADPEAGLIQASNGYLYGTTHGMASGTVFRVAPSGALTTLYTFCSQSGCTDGGGPSGLVQATNGNLYGTTISHGANGYGTVFKITPGGTLTTIYSFCSQSGCADGAMPYAGLVQAGNGSLYGTTNGGGKNGYGTIFRITPSGALTTLYSFCSVPCSDGAGPVTGLVQASNGYLYGTTPQGGANGGGTIFRVTPGGALTTLYNFCSQSGCADGMGPDGGLVQASDGNLYGTTGGPNGQGTIFTITPSGALTTLYRFCSISGCADGTDPQGGLIQASDGNFYGTTVEGGANNTGTIFMITPTGTLTTLYSFCTQSGCLDGEYPEATLTQASDGNLYGTTAGGGANYDGTVFRLSLGLAPPTAIPLQ